MPNITKKGALEVTSTLDRVATLFQEEFETLGVPQKLAFDFARRCDLLSDHVERLAGARTALTGDDAVKEQGFDPEEVGQEVAGPEEKDSDEGFLNGEFTQQENRELRERQQEGDLNPTQVNDEPQAPAAGKQAAKLRRQMQAAVIAGASPRLVKALALAAKVAEEEESEAKKADDEETEDKAEGKKAGEMPPQFKENAEKKKEEAKAKKEEEKPAAKKASHGFRLNA